MDLSEYDPRAPGTDPLYTAIEEAVLHAYRGERVAAQRRIEAALEGFVRLGDARGEARARAKAAIVFRHTGDHKRATREAHQALAVLVQAPDRHFRCTAVLELQQLLTAADDPAAAIELFEASSSGSSRPGR
jgi:hypothetical protein